MDKICWLDVIILLPLLFGLIRGLMRGLVTELNAVLAVLLGVLGSRLCGADFATWIVTKTSWPQAVANVIAYVLLFLSIAIVLTLLGKVFQKLLKKINLGWVNRLLGGICGTIKWSVIVLVLIWITGQLDTNFKLMPTDLKQQSRLYQPALDTADKAVATLPVK